MNQTWENGKKPNFRCEFSPFDPNLGFPNFFRGSNLYYMFIVTCYHCIQSHRKLMIQTQKMAKKTHFRPDLSLFGPNSSHQNFFIKLVVRHRYPKHSSYAIYRKINKSSLRKWWKTYFQAQFWPISPKFGPPKFFWGFYLY